MSTVSKHDLVRDYVTVVRGVGLSLSDLPEPHDGSGEATPERVADDLESFRPERLHDRLRSVLARSSRGIEAPREYWSLAPGVQLTEVLEPFGYRVSLEDVEDGDDRFEVVLRGGPTTGTRRMRFSYPDTSLGTDNYPALVHAVESRLLPEPELTIVRLVERDDERTWRFLLVERDRLAKLRRKFGERLEVFGQPLLAQRQPADFAVGDTVEPAAEDDEPREVPSPPELDDLFEDIEREAATSPVRTEDREVVPPRTDQTDSLEVDQEVRRLLSEVDLDHEEAGRMDEVSADRIDGVLERTGPAAVGQVTAYEWLSGVDEVAGGPGAGTGIEPAVDGRPQDDDGRLSEQVAETLFREEADDGGSAPAAAATGVGATTTTATTATTSTPDRSRAGDDPDTAAEEILDEEVRQEADQVFGDLGDPHDSGPESTDGTATAATTDEDELRSVAERRAAERDEWVLSDDDPSADDRDDDSSGDADEESPGPIGVLTGFVRRLF